MKSKTLTRASLLHSFYSNQAMNQLIMTFRS
uniref:Uncharacterized protein n=1 Tax=Picea glauca TaxID=3330 RepID=A0A101LTR5_PICGL|nr:hypothetical protein ABT39_MTgene3581 [Picea glauca]